MAEDLRITRAREVVDNWGVINALRDLLAVVDEKSDEVERLTSEVKRLHIKLSWINGGT